MELDVWVNEIIPRLSVADVISLSQTSRFCRQAVEEARFINPLLTRRRRLESRVALDRIHLISSGRDRFVMIFVHLDPEVRGEVSIVHTNDQWKTVHESQVGFYLAGDVKMNNKYGPSNGEDWFKETWTMSIGSSRSIRHDPARIHCLLLPADQIEWFAIKLNGTSWDNNHGWNYSIEYETKIGAVPLYQSPNIQYMYNFERYDRTEIDGDWDGPGKDYGSNIYLPTADDWKRDVLGSHVRRYT